MIGCREREGAGVEGQEAAVRRCPQCGEVSIEDGYPSRWWFYLSLLATLRGRDLQRHRGRGRKKRREDRLQLARGAGLPDRQKLRHRGPDRFVEGHRQGLWLRLQRGELRVRRLV